MCNTVWSKPRKCKCVGTVEETLAQLNKLANADISVYEKEIWNAAIEAAAKVCDTSKGYPTWNSEEIRKLKK